jgi:hypothetical protein
MKDILLFDMPIYRSSPALYASKLKERKEKDIRNKQAAGLTPVETYIFPSWRYNEIVGWVNVSIFNNRIFGEYWVKQRIIKGINKTEFKHKGKLFVYHLRNRTLTSIDIFDKVNQKLKSSFAETMPKYYLDSTLFDNISPYIDWTAIHRKATSNESITGRGINHAGH